MNRINTYKDALTEVYTILDYLEKEDFSKIPNSLIQTIEKNRNINYIYIMDDEADLSNQPMLPETKAILFNIFRDYLSEPEQKEKIIKIQQEERIKAEQLKSERCSSNINFRKTHKVELNAEKASLVEVKQQSLLSKILNKITAIFKK